MPERHFFCVFPQLIIHKYKANLAVVEWSAQWFKANSVWSMLGVSSSSSQCPKKTTLQNGEFNVLCRFKQTTVSKWDIQEYQTFFFFTM